MVVKEIILFDMDGVLLTPGGYHKALQDSVAFLGDCLGFPDVVLTQDQIHAFEAVGVTNEWDSLAICLAAMVEVLVEGNPTAAIDVSIFNRPFAANGLRNPDFWSIIDQLKNISDARLNPIDRAMGIFPERLHWILEQAYSIEGISQRVQQEHVLGSDDFAKAYQLNPLKQVPSYLLKYDRNNLSVELRNRLMVWRSEPGNRAVVFTNRPSISPDGKWGTPEAEQGLNTVGLSGFDLASTGGVVWLETMYGKDKGTYNKPHPVHALAALRCATGESAEEAFTAAGRFYENNILDDSWKKLSGSRVVVFEDSTAGFTSLRVASELLSEIGVLIEVELIGISENESKLRTLRDAGARVFAELAPGLTEIFESRGL